MKREPFPLAWPDGWPRTSAARRARSRFGVRGQVSFADAYNFLRAEFNRLGAANVVVTSDLPTQRDGTPYSTGSRPVADPGIAVWFVLDGHERVMPCDRWLSPAENMYAIAMTVEAMRGIDRWGSGDVVHRAFSGFAALPPGGDPEPPRRTWREVLDMSSSAYAALTVTDQLAIAKARHRDSIKKAHPDAGGSPELAAEINAALADAERELGGHS